MLAEFREIDSYFTDSEDEYDEDSQSTRPSLAQTEFDNSVLRMGRSLLTAAEVNPVEGTEDIPRVTLRLTRLKPSAANASENDPRIAQTIQCLRDMGVDVELGERIESEMPAAVPIESSSSASALSLEPTTHVNLDLSVLIALVSDLTHSPLPKTVEDANTRFVPPQRYREWKQKRLGMNGKSKDGAQCKDVAPGGVPDSGDAGDVPQDLAKHSRALTNQVLQEMCKGLLQEMHDKLLLQRGHIGNDQSPIPSGSFPQIQFWTTREARDRCIRIITKIGGVSEKRRAHALFPDVASISSDDSASTSQAEELYWQGSRYPSKFIPLFPIRIYPPSFPSLSALDPSLDMDRIRSNDVRALPVFFKSLGKTCKDILAQETIPHPRALPDDLVLEDGHESGATRSISHSGEIQRAIVTKANPRLTAHTVQSMLWGAELGWTTLTANKTSVKAILREMRAARIAGRLDGGGSAVAGGVGSTRGGGSGGETKRAAIWIVDPRSLAEGMRSDG